MNNNFYAENVSELMHYQSRTKFPIHYDRAFTMNKGLLYPGYALEVLPGDTWQINLSYLLRMQTLKKPIMSNLWIQIQGFFVPNRLVDPHWEEVMGANKKGPFIKNQTTYTVPKLRSPSGGWQKGTLGDILGFPTYEDNIFVNSYYTKGYCLIRNDWFRDENRQEFCNITQEGDIIGSNGDNYVTDCELGGQLAPVAKSFDYFTSSFIDAQKGPEVFLPFAESKAPVLTYDEHTTSSWLKSLVWQKSTSASDQTLEGQRAMFTWGSPTTEEGEIPSAGTFVGQNAEQTHTSTGSIYPANLWANLEEVTSISMNTLRNLAALQQLYELDNIGGTRYIEMIYSHFNVRSSDARLQRSEYLGGKRVPINISQVIQTSQTSGNNFQGDLSGMSQSWDGDEYFTKSFEEHGIMYIMICIKGENIYQQGLNAKFQKFKRTDFYDPIFANLGLQPIRNSEIYAQGNAEDNETFGFKMAWDEYRTFYNEVAGELRSNAPNSLDVYHIARDFSELPTNGSEFIEEGKTNLDRTLTVTSEQADQFIIQLSLEGSSVTRIMPPYSVPGLKRF